MPIGDINIKTLKAGDIDLLNYSQASYAGFNIFEDILNPYGPSCEIRVIDHSDALGKSNLNGDYSKDVEIKFALVEGDNKEEAAFKFKLYRNKDLDDGASDNQGSGHHKQYNVLGVSQEMLNAQGNYVSKSYNDLTSTMVQDILKNNFKTDKTIEIGEATKGKRRMVFGTEHPLTVIQKLNDEHVANESESSCYVCFQKTDNGKQKYVFTTFEQMFKQPSVVTLTQRTTLDLGGSTTQDYQDSIRWIKVADSFFTPSRPLSNSIEQTFNLTTHSVVATKPKATDFYTADGKAKTVYANTASYAKEIPAKKMLDKVNDKNKHGTATAKKKRSEFISHLAQNSAELEVIGNPKIKLGSMIDLKIFKKADTENAAGEKQFNGKALVVAIRHKIAPLGQSPRYTMILRVVKASYKEGNGGNA
jgi:DNA polymerase III psi subunit